MFSCVCAYCYNIIYNAKKLSLLKMGRQISQLGVASVRLEFTKEDVREVAEVLHCYEQSFLKEAKEVEEILESTRGHFKRGVK